MPSVNSLSITDKLLSQDQTFSITFVALNEAGSSSSYGAIDDISIEVFSDINSTEYYVTPSLTQFLSQQIPKGSSRSITIDLKTVHYNDGASHNLFDYLHNNSLRGIQVSVRITIHTTTGASAPSQTFNTIGGSAISVVETRMNPKIDKIQFKRCTNNNVLDEQGEYISSTIKTSFSNSSYYSNFKMKFEQCYSINGSAGSVISTKEFNPSDSSDLNILNSFLTGVTNSNILIGQLNTFTFSTAYYIRVTLYDTYESSVALVSVPSSFVNVHLSGTSTGGVALGQFSSATEGNPFFESDYPAKFYKDVSVLNSNLQVNGGSNVNKGQLSVTSTASFGGDVTCSSNLSASNGTVSAKKLQAGASGISSSGGLTVSSGSTSVQALTSSTLTVTGSAAMPPVIAIQTAQGNDLIRINNWTNTVNNSTVHNGSATFTGAATFTGGATFTTTAVSMKSTFNNMKGGTTTSVSIGAGNSNDFTVTYTGYSAAPYIIGNLYGSENLSKMSLQIVSVSSTQCVFRVYNTGSASHSVAIRWMAFSTLS